MCPALEGEGMGSLATALNEEVITLLLFSEHRTTCVELQRQHGVPHGWLENRILRPLAGHSRRNPGEFSDLALLAVIPELFA